MIKINNWSNYQSYKDRRPPWIRFHRSMLDNYEYQLMSSDSRALLPMLWLLACEDSDPKSGLIQLENKVISFRLRQDIKTINKCIKELQDADFIECIESVTESLQDSSQSVTPEPETETETETEFNVLWVSYGRRGNKKTSLNKFKKLSVKSRSKLLDKIPIYIKSTPDLNYRKHLERYIEKECWNDEIVKNPNTRDNELSILKQAGIDWANEADDDD